MYKICQEKIALLASRSNKKLSKIIKDLSEAHSSVFDQLCKLMFNSYEKFNERSQSSSHDLSRASNQVSSLLSTIEKLESEVEKLKKDQKESFLSFQEEKQDLLKEVESLQEENRKYLDTIIKHSKSNAGSVLSTSTYEEKPKMVSQSLATRTLSLKQLKDVIAEIYESKSKFDEKCAESKMPRETMEQHMYTFLNQKYGLRSLIIEWVAAIITGIKTFSVDDNDVAVFGKILRNECDEEFRFVQNQVKETVNELLRIQIKNKFPMKAANDINKIVEERVNGVVLEDEWTEVVKYMYNDSDSQVLLNQIWQNANSRPSNSVKIRTSREDLLKKENKLAVVSYAEFLKLLLDFQLKAHEKFLGPFIKVFRMVGSSKSGVLNENDFIIVCQKMQLEESTIMKLLAVVDPYENQAITFSECVALFSTEVFPNKNIPILQELSMNS
jgi:DNA repair exonuclease SbcCD ATPase subunit